MTVDLMDMFQRHGYEDAFLFGHALEGNLHLVFSQVGAALCRAVPCLLCGRLPPAPCPKMWRPGRGRTPAAGCWGARGGVPRGRGFRPSPLAQRGLCPADSCRAPRPVLPTPAPTPPHSQIQRTIFATHL